MILTLFTNRLISPSLQNVTATTINPKAFNPLSNLLADLFNYDPNTLFSFLWNSLDDKYQYYRTINHTLKGIAQMVSGFANMNASVPIHF